MMSLPSADNQPPALASGPTAGKPTVLHSIAYTLANAALANMAGCESLTVSYQSDRSTPDRFDGNARAKGFAALAAAMGGTEKAFLFTSTPGRAEDFAAMAGDGYDEATDTRKGGENIMPVFVRAENPFDFERQDLGDAISLQHRSLWIYLD
jgi:hypothetical protein